VLAIAYAIIPTAEIADSIVNAAIFALCFSILGLRRIQ